MKIGNGICVLFIALSFFLLGAGKKEGEEYYEGKHWREWAKEINTGDEEVQRHAFEALGQTASKKMIPTLIKALKGSDENMQREIFRIFWIIGQPSLAAVMKLAYDKDINIRRQAISFISEFDDSKVLRLLRKIVLDKNEKEEIRSYAATPYLKTLGLKDVPFLLDLFEKNNGMLCYDILKTLADIGGKQAIDALIEIARTNNKEYRCTAIELLGYRRREEAVPVLIKMLENNDESSKAAMEALALIGDRRATLPLIKIASDPIITEDGDLIWRAIFALGQMRDEAALPVIMQHLHGDNAILREAVIVAAGIMRDERVVPDLLKFFEDDSHYEIIKALRKINHKSSVSLLMKLLEDNSSFVRRDVVNILYHLEDVSAIPGLVAELQDSPGICVTAAQGLGRINDEAVIPELIKALENMDEDVRKAAVRGLSSFRGNKEVIYVLRGLVARKNPFVLSTAITALGIMKERSAVPDLLSILDDKEYNEEWDNAIEALARIGDRSVIPRLREMFEDWPESRLVWALGVLRAEEAIPLLKRALYNTDSNFQRTAALALGKIGGAAVPVLLEAFENDDMREYIVEGLGLTNDSRVLPALLKALDERRNRKRGNAALVLGLDNDHSTEIRKKAALALARIGLRSAVPALIKKLRDPDESVRLCAIEALGMIGDKAATPALIRAAGGRNEAVSEAAIKALGALRDTSAVTFLLKKLKSENEEIRCFAVDALGAIGDSAAVPTLISIIENRGNKFEYDYDIQRMIRALGNIKDRRAVPVLMEYLRYRNVNAAIALGKIGDKSAVPLLLRAFRYKDEEMEELVSSCVCGYYASALGDIGDKSVIPELQKAFRYETDEAKIWIAYALAKMGDNSKIPYLKHCMVREMGLDENVVQAAFALALLGDKEGISYLIERIDSDDFFDSSMLATYDILREATGQNFGNDPIPWQKWWEENKEK